MIILGIFLWVGMTWYAFKKKGWGSVALWPAILSVVGGFVLGIAGEGGGTEAWSYLMIGTFILFGLLVIMCFKKGPQYKPPKPKTAVVNPLNQNLEQRILELETQVKQKSLEDKIVELEKKLKNKSSD